jgi:hypothetical protein
MAVADRLRQYSDEQTMQLPPPPPPPPAYPADEEEPLYGEVCPYATVQLVSNPAEEKRRSHFGTLHHQVYQKQHVIFQNISV